MTTRTELADLAESLVPVAARLIGAVHDDGLGEVARILHAIPPAHQPAMLVVLAAMCDPEQSAADALGWVTWDDEFPRLPEADLFAARVPDPDADLRVDTARWTDERCAELNAAWRRRQRGKGDPLSNAFLEKQGSREHNRRRKAVTRAAARANIDGDTVCQPG